MTKLVTWSNRDVFSFRRRPRILRSLIIKDFLARAGFCALGIRKHQVLLGHVFASRPDWFTCIQISACIVIGKGKEEPA